MKYMRNKKRHTFVIAEYQLPYIKMLFENKKDNQYYILESGNGYADIIQYSAKYKDIHLVTVPVKYLDYKLRLG